jgi:hypothetical protein
MKKEPVYRPPVYTPKECMPATAQSVKAKPNQSQVTESLAPVWAGTTLPSK